MPKKRKRRALDAFERTPLRRYDRAPQEESRLEHAERFRKRHFDFPQIPHGTELDRVIMGMLCLTMLLVFCNGSAPLSEVPSVQSRFEDWAAVQNEKTVKILPGPTPEPDSELAQAATFDTAQQQAVIEQAMATPDPNVTPAPKFKLYEPGELQYKTEKMSVSIEQKHKDGMTYFVCDIQLTDVSQLRTAFAGDDFRSGIYEAVSDIAGRYSPVMAINADFCRYHREGVIIRNGEVLRRQNIKRHHLLIVDENGNMSAETDRSGKQGLVANRLEQANTWQTFEFGPVLVEDGEPVDLPKNFYINCAEDYDNPRTAIGQKGPLHYIVIVVDGRREGYSTGASIPQVQQLFLDEGVDFAFNLDGGGSTTLYFLGEVINMPSGGKERSVSDVLMFMANPQ